MAEAVEQIRGTVFVGRKLSDKNFGSFEFGVHFPVEFSQGAPAAEQTDAVVAAFDQANAIIAGQISPLVATLAAQEFSAPARPTRGSSSDAVTVQHFCEKCQAQTEHFDNRADIASGKVKPKSPKLKCRTCRTGVWDLDEAA